MKKIFFGIAAVLMLLSISSCTKTKHDTSGSLLVSVLEIVSSSELEPLSGVNVTLNPGGMSSATGSDGWVEFKDLAPQQYTIQVQKTGYQTNRTTTTVVVGETKQVVIPMQKIP